MRIRISDGTEITLGQVPDDARHAKFDQHKKKLLDMLRQERSPKAKPFDEEKAWRRLKGLVRHYHEAGGGKEKTRAANELTADLLKLAKALGKARNLVEDAMQDEIGSALYSSWCEANARFRDDAGGLGPPARVGGQTFDPVHTKNEFDKAVAGLATLENAALRAADDVPDTKRGRPAILSRDEIWNLAALYRFSTGSIPGACDGPFAKFVMEFLAAQGRYNALEDHAKRVQGAIKYLSVVDAIVDTRQWALTDPLARKWAPSPFDEEE
jgi:hypothetical protein